jgi:hypothetical protein
MMENVIVFSTIGFAAIFFIAWWLRPDLRAWIERPKYGFQKSVQSYDQTRRKERT